MAGSFIRRFTKWFFVSFNILICIIFLLSCLSPFVSPGQWAPIGFLSLAAPYLAILLIFSILFWLVAKPVIALVPIFTLLIGWKQLEVVFAWHPMHKFSIETKNDSIVRIINWNVRGLYGISNNPYKQLRNRDDIFASINKLNADIICLHEFNNVTYAANPRANNFDMFKDNCPYYFFSKDFTNSNGSYLAGSIIFSRYPIIDSGKIKFSGPESESLLYIDILKGEDTVRIYTAHLQSFEFKGNDYADIEKIKNQDEEAIQASKNIYSKMKLAFTRRTAQADIVKSELDKCPYPSIIAGDFNDVPNSYTYFHIKGQRQDAFLKTAFGIGRSYNSLAPTLRIDYILPDEHFNIHQFDMIDEGLSDHSMLVSDISLKK